MDLIEINPDKKVLIITTKDTIGQVEAAAAKIPTKTVKSVDDLSGLQDNSQDTILLQVVDEHKTDAIFNKLFKLGKPGSSLIVDNVANDAANVQFNLKISGFTNVEIKQTSVVAVKPNYEIGSAAKLNLKKNAVWKLEDDDETIDPDELLDEDDLKKPDPSSLRVCGTTGKRKACKDCSCGLAEELETEAQAGKVVDTSNAPKSSCGSCYLGDAFRCATCPYLGMPAFKPGEKIQLSDNLLKADI